MPKNTKDNLYTPEELELMRAVEAGELVPVPNMDSEMKRIREMAKATIASQNISIRLDPDVLSTIKDKASERGLPYQTLIKAILYQYAEGKVKIIL